MVGCYPLTGTCVQDCTKGLPVSLVLKNGHISFKISDWAQIGCVIKEIYQEKSIAHSAEGVRWSVDVRSTYAGRLVSM